jgi:Ca2+-binding RTX toxin-like protein
VNNTSSAAPGFAIWHHDSVVDPRRGKRGAKEEYREMRRAILVLTLIPATVLLAAGVALAAVITCPGGECQGTNEADKITGTQGVDTIDALAGNDSVLGRSGGDDIYGNEGNDRLSGDGGPDKIYGGPGDDIDLDGDARIDEIYGEAGNDLELDGDKGNDELYGGPGDDGGPPTTENIQRHGLRGEGDANLVHGGDGADTINAVWAADRGGAQEQIFGGNDNDTIAAKDGVKDVIDCGDGLSDTVVSHDVGLDVLKNCEVIQAATAAQ